MFLYHNLISDSVVQHYNFINLLFPISWCIFSKSWERINLRWLTFYPHPHLVMHFLEIAGSHTFGIIDLLPPPPFHDIFSSNIMNPYIWDDWPPTPTPISCWISWKYKEPIYLWLMSATPTPFQDAFLGNRMNELLPPPQFYDAFPINLRKS